MSDAGFGNKLHISQRRYLGSKARLLTFIDSILVKEKVKFSTFADLFAGTGVVANHYLPKANIIANDILESNYLAYQAFFGAEEIQEEKLTSQIQYYNTIDPNRISQNYFSKNFAGTYFDLPNSKLIGYIREDIERLSKEGKLTPRERAYLITVLIYAMDRIANTVGHYDAFRKVNIRPRRIELKELNLTKTKFSASIFKKDANELARDIKADLVYIDPPYNSRQYSDAYHLLENVAVWNKQEVFGVARKNDRSHLKSKYSLKSAGAAFSELVNQLNARFILVSYNDMGTSGDPRSQARISDHEIISALERRGIVTVYEKDFNQFTTGTSKRTDLKERIFFCRVTRKKQKPSLYYSDKNNHLPVFVKSPLNYTGGKHKLLSQITALFPANIETFLDVFCGGANVGINAVASRIICIDKNKKVIELLRYIQKTNFEELNQKLLKVVREYRLSQSYIHGYDHYRSQSSAGLGIYNKNAYLKLRSVYNSAKKKDPLLLLVLVLYGFNNQIRFNSKKEFNLPVGKRDYNGSSRRNLANFNAISNHKDITFQIGDFRDLKKYKFKKNDFVYLDPPYILGHATYNEAGGWTEKDELDLLATLDVLNKRGIRFALSNVVTHKGRSHTQLLKWIKNGHYKMHYLSHDYRNASYQTKAKSSQSTEVLVTNY